MRYFGSWSNPDAALARYQGETNERIKIAPIDKPNKPLLPFGPHSPRITG